jgi:hypothetical protein
MPTIDKALSLCCPKCSHMFDVILSVTPYEVRDKAPHPFKPFKQYDPTPDTVRQAEGKRWQVCAKCRTHTNQVAKDLGNGRSKWVCQICGHMPKKSWLTNIRKDTSNDL